MNRHLLLSLLIAVVFGFVWDLSAMKSTGIADTAQQLLLLLAVLRVADTLSRTREEGMGLSRRFHLALTLAVFLFTRFQPATWDSEGWRQILATLLLWVGLGLLLELMREAVTMRKSSKGKKKHRSGSQRHGDAN